jgi:hypothetical protein
MFAHDRFRHLCTAILFVVAMLALGLMNPNAVPGSAGCGLACDAANAPWSGG